MNHKLLTSILVSLLLLPLSAKADITEHFCSPTTYLLGCTKYASSGVYQDVDMGDGTTGTLRLTIGSPSPATTVEDSIALGGTYLFGCQRIPATAVGTATYTDALTNTSGCDSLVTLSLRVYRPFVPRDTTVYWTDSIALGGTYLFGCQRITPTVLGSSDYTDILSPWLGGGDSTSVLTLRTYKAAPVVEPEVLDTICEGTTYTWNRNGKDYTAAGLYHDTLVGAVRDTAVSLHLTINPVRRTNIDTTVCEGTSVRMWGHDYVVGTYTQTLSSTVTGCDSVITLNVHEQSCEPLRDTITDAVCGGSYLFGCRTLTESGTYSDTLSSMVSVLDSIVTLQLTIHTVQDTTIRDTICAGDSLLFFGKYYHTAGDYRDTTKSIITGCDSIGTLRLMVNQPTTGDTTATICRGDLPYEWHGQILNTKGSATYTLTNAAGCDSVVTLTLTVQEPTMAAEETVSVCESALPYNWLDHYEVNTAGIHRDTVYYTTGCDSVYYTLHLIVNQPTTGDTTATICRDELPYEWYGQTLNEAGTLTRVITNAAGCDSVVTLTLVVNEPTAGDTTAAICVAGLPYIWYGQTLTQAGTTTHTLTNAAGCDSVVTLTLVVNEPMTIDTTVTICEGRKYLLGTTELTESGSYTYTTASLVTGCDSTTNLTLVVTPAEVDYISETICEGDTYDLHGTLLSTAGTYRDTTYAADGCMSITELTLSTRTCLARAEVSVTGFVCPGTEYRGRLTSHIITEAVSWTDSVRVNVDGVPTDSLYDYSIAPYVTTLPAISTDDVQAICGQAIYVDEAVSKVEAHIAAESHYAPNHIIAWEVQTNGTWQPLNITTAIRGGVEQLTIRLTVITDCGVETSAPLTAKVETPAPENTASMDNVPAVSKYSDYLLMIDKREIETTFGWTLQPADVRWYRVVGTIDNYADGSTRDDEQVGEGFYYTVGAQLAGSFYACITHEPTTATECSGELRTVELICSASKAAPQLAPNVARPAEQIRVLNLNPECTTEIRVYSVNGELLETYTSQEAVEFFLRAAGTAGYYMVDVQTDDEKVTLQYIVK